MSKYKKAKLADVILKANTGADAIKRASIVSYDSGIRCLRIQDISQKKKFVDWGFCKVNDEDRSKFLLK
jgi:type I restriction enzyme S subunit